MTERVVDPIPQGRVAPTIDRPARRWLAAAALVVLGALAAAVALAVQFAPPTRLAVSTAEGEALAFEPAELVADAGRPIEITFTNGSALQHNLTFTGPHDPRTRTIVEPGGTDVVVVRPDGPGIHPFVCTIHDGMAGRLVVQADSGG